MRTSWQQLWNYLIIGTNTNSPKYTLTNQSSFELNAWVYSDFHLSWLCRGQSFYHRCYSLCFYMMLCELGLTLIQALEVNYNQDFERFFTTYDQHTQQTGDVLGTFGDVPIRSLKGSGAMLPHLRSENVLRNVAWCSQGNIPWGTFV